MVNIRSFKRLNNTLSVLTVTNLKINENNQIRIDKVLRGIVLPPPGGGGGGTWWNIL